MRGESPSAKLSWEAFENMEMQAPSRPSESECGGEVKASSFLKGTPGDHGGQSARKYSNSQGKRVWAQA